MYTCNSCKLILWAIAIAEGKVVGTEFTDWNTPKKSLWYCFGTLIGESLSRGTKSMEGNALRQTQKYPFKNVSTTFQGRKLNFPQVAFGPLDTGLFAP